MAQYIYFRIKNWLTQEEEGQDLAEYALLLVFIAIVVIAAVGAIGVNITALFNDSATTFAGL